MYDAADADALAELAPSEDAYGFLRRWLFRAGFRGSSAVATFASFTLILAGLGLLFALLVISSGLMQRGVQVVNQVPGGIGDILLPVIYLGPWIMLAMLAMS